MSDGLEKPLKNFLGDMVKVISETDVDNEKLKIANMAFKLALDTAASQIWELKNKNADLRLQLDRMTSENIKLISRMED